MKYLFKTGDRVVLRATGRGAIIISLSNKSWLKADYRILCDAEDDTGVKLVKYVPEADLLPENPTYQQCEQELCRVLEQMVTLAKRKLALIEESTVWAKKMRDLKPKEESKTDMVIAHGKAHGIEVVDIGRHDDPIAKLVP